MTTRANGRTTTTAPTAPRTLATQITPDELDYLNEAHTEANDTLARARAARQQAMEAETRAAVAEGVRNSYVAHLMKKYAIDPAVTDISLETGAITRNAVPTPITAAN